MVSMAVVMSMVGVIGHTTSSSAAETEAAAALQKSVLVTGASSGIGLKITEVLAERGVHVWAGARKEADLKRLDAMEAFADSLAREMERFDVKVSIVEPGNYKSKIGESLKKRIDAKGADYSSSAYKEEMDRMMARVENADEQKDPAEVAEAVHHALFDENPKMRYMVVPYDRQAEITINKAIEEMVQLNEDQPYTYDRDTLVKMLDEALAATESAGN
jgi:hypothetical protein